MEDTSLEANRIVREVVMSKTAEERFLICAQMYEDAREFARIGMPQGLSLDEEKEFLFKCIHGKTPAEIVSSDAFTDD